MKLILLLAVLFSGCLFNSSRGRIVSEPVDTFAEVPEPSFFKQDTVVVLPVKPPPDITRWPSDRDFVFFVSYQKDLQLQMQWRQVCGSFDSDWYDMLGRDQTDPMDASYMVRPSAAGDTVVVMSSAMRSFPRSGCEWSFRFRLASRRNFSDWVVLDEKIILVDPSEFERQIIKPKIQVIRDGKKETPE